MIDLHTHVVKSNSIFNAGLDIITDGYYSTGIHPNSAHKLINWHLFEEKIKHKNCLAVGECGLDTLVLANLQTQQKILLQQAEYAQAYQKPLIIHVVRAHYELVSCLKKFQLPIIIHGFNGNKNILDLYMQQGYYLSLGHALLNKKSNVYQLISQIPTTQLFLETDNSGLDIKVIYKQASELLNLSTKELEQILKENFIRVFMV